MAEQMFEIPVDRIRELNACEQARIRTIKRMEESLKRDPRAMVNAKQVINLLSLTWPDGNYSNV